MILSNTKIDAIGIKERVARLQSRSIKATSKQQALNMALSMIDLTTLEGRDSPNKVRQLCYKATHLHENFPNLPNVAAICVYAPLVKTARHALQGSNVKVASVATAFPSGMSDIDSKLDEVKRAAEDGANEIDMVISRGRFLSGDYNYVADEIQKIKEVCGSAHLKVILETGELVTLDNVRIASELAIQSGADFIKTSTGKVQPAATPEVTLVMMQAIRDHYIKSGKLVGLKPAGGISKSKQAIQYLVMLRETLGQSWLNPKLFRFGASSLANDILMQIVKQNTGIYQSTDYFSLD